LVLENRERFMRKSVIYWFLFVIFSMPLLSLTAQEGHFWVDRFSPETIKNNIPEGWSLNQKEGNPEIKLEKSGRGYALHLRSDNSSFGLKKELEVDIKEYPYLNWRWKVSRLPEKGDFQKKETDDQAGQVYVLFPRFPSTLNTEMVGYIWESNPSNKGKEGESPAWDKSKVVVLQAGAERLNHWCQEKRNVYEDYKRLFGKEPPKAGGLALYINSQHTKGKAYAAYGPIFFSKN
jgi:hypothetical protein